MDRDKWLKQIAKLASTLGKLDQNEDHGVRAALVTTWHVISIAPRTILHLFSNLREAELAQDGGHGPLGSKGFGFKTPRSVDDREILLSLGRFLRLLEDVVLASVTEERPADAKVQWSARTGKHRYFLIARLGLKPVHSRLDGRPFSQRGLRFYRVLPAKLDDDITIHIACLDLAQESRKSFGAALFGRDIDLEKHRSKTGYVAKAVIAANLENDVKGALRNSDLSGCRLLVYPELTIDPERRKLIARLLADRPWEDEADLPEGEFEFVVPGSWHIQTEKGHANEMVVLDGTGAEVLRHRKMFAAADEQGLAEEIEPGHELHVLVANGRLFGFGICLDVCQHYFNSPYTEIDVDYLIVPSWGNGTTMDGHIGTARAMYARFRTLSFIVQQGIGLENGLGFILPPRSPQKSTAEECVSAQGFTACELTKGR
jgi:hypothetical protein